MKQKKKTILFSFFSILPSSTSLPPNNLNRLLPPYPQRQKRGKKIIKKKQSRRACKARRTKGLRTQNKLLNTTIENWRSLLSILFCTKEKTKESTKEIHKKPNDTKRFSN